MSLCNYSRRRFVQTAAAAIAAPALVRAGALAAPVAVARCRTYSSAELLAVMQKMFDQLGGLGRIVKGKTVAVKINLTGAPSYRVRHLPAEDTHYTHPAVIA